MLEVGVYIFTVIGAVKNKMKFFCIKLLYDTIVFYLYAYVCTCALYRFCKKDRIKKETYYKENIVIYWSSFIKTIDGK